MPKYLYASVCVTRLLEPGFWTASGCFQYFDLLEQNSVLLIFSWFIVNLLLPNHVWTVSRSCSSLILISSRLFPFTNKAVLSAYKKVMEWIVTLLFCHLVVKATSYSFHGGSRIGFLLSAPFQCQTTFTYYYCMLVYISLMNRIKWKFKISWRVVVAVTSNQY